MMITLYMLAGINHFINPAFYLKIIPPYLGNPTVINNLAGVAELLLAVMLMFPRTRKLAAFGIILMLIAFLPAHIFMLQQATAGAPATPPTWILWVRLVLIQPLLIWWAWTVRKPA